MIEHNWLYNYKNTWGIEKSFAGLVKRAVYLEESTVAFSLFNEHYEALKLLYQAFYPDLKKFAEAELLRLLNA